MRKGTRCRGVEDVGRGHGHGQIGWRGGRSDGCRADTWGSNSGPPGPSHGSLAAPDEDTPLLFVWMRTRARTCTRAYKKWHDVWSQAKDGFMMAQIGNGVITMLQKVAQLTVFCFYHGNH
jgi:hypothetical protein